MKEQYLVKIEMVEGERTMEFSVDSKEDMEMYIKEFEREKNDFKFKRFIVYDKSTGDPVYFYRAKEE